MASKEANLFELWGRGIHVSYATTSIDGKPRLTYRAYGEEKSFAGEQIRLADTELGTQVTVTLAAIPDLKSTTFTVVIPRVNIADDHPRVRFCSVGIHTDHFTSIGGPALVRGALSSNDGTDLHGIAQSVLF